MKNIFKQFHFRDGLVWMVSLTMKIIVVDTGIVEVLSSECMLYDKIK